MNRNQRRYGKSPSTRNTDNCNPRRSNPKISVETPKCQSDRINYIYIPHDHSADQPRQSNDQPTQGNDQPKQGNDQPKQDDDQPKLVIAHPNQDNDQRKPGNAQLKIGIQQVMPPKDMKIKGVSDNIVKTNRACTVAPESQSFGQFTHEDLPPDPEMSLYHSLLAEQYGFDPIEGVDKATVLSPARDFGCKVDHASQYDDREVSPVLVETFDGSQWHNIDTADEVDRFISSDMVNSSKQTSSLYCPQNIRVSEVPTVKIIAQKFTKFKKNDVELRRLVDKIVCLEYDVFDVDREALVEQPVQKMRAFFSVKPTGGEKSCERVPTIPSAIKNRFNIVDDNLKNLDEKEIEIIDEKIAENKCYLEELKRVLKRKQAIIDKKNKTSLDLLSLYEMAKRENPPMHYDFSNTNLLSKAELEDVKELILKTRCSSARGIRRKTMRDRRGSAGSKLNEPRNTESIIMDFF